MLNNIESIEDIGVRTVLHLPETNEDNFFQKNLNSSSENNMYVVRYGQHSDVSRNLN